MTKFSVGFWRIFNRVFRPDLLVDYDDASYPPDDFTGVWETHWPNGRRKARIEHKDGKRHGVSQIWWENGKLCQEGRSEDGECVGIWRKYLYSGVFFKEEEFYRPGSFDVRWYDGDKLIRVQRFRDGVEI